MLLSLCCSTSGNEVTQGRETGSIEKSRRCGLDSIDGECQSPMDVRVSPFLDCINQAVSVAEVDVTM